MEIIHYSSTLGLCNFLSCMSALRVDDLFSREYRTPGMVCKADIEAPAGPAELLLTNTDMYSSPDLCLKRADCYLSSHYTHIARYTQPRWPDTGTSTITAEAPLLHWPI